MSRYLYPIQCIYINKLYITSRYNIVYMIHLINAFNAIDLLVKYNTIYYIHIIYNY